MEAIMLILTAVISGVVLDIFGRWVERKELFSTRKQSRTIISSKLPHQDYPLQGRQEEVKRAVAVLDKKHRMGTLAIRGIGGIGKSALAIQIAYICRERKMFDAIFWLSAKRETLSEIGIKPREQAFFNFDDVFMNVIRVLQPKLIPTPAESRLETLMDICSKKRILIILDNFEVIEDERINEFLREIPSPSKAIITSRTWVSATYDIELKGLAYTDSLALMKTVSENSPTYIIKEGGYKKLFERTSGVPLAMVWCIGQILYKGKSIESVLDNLKNMDINDDLCKFCFRESFNLLDSDERKIVFALSLLEEPVSHEVVGIIGGMERNTVVLEDALAKLKQLSLVSEKFKLVEMLPLTKSYARAIMSQDPTTEQEIVERWVRYYISTDVSIIPVTIYFSANFLGTHLQQRIEVLVQQFNSLGFGIRVTASFRGTYIETREALLQAFAKGPVPDAAVLGASMWLEMVKKGHVLPLDTTILSSKQDYLVEAGFDPAFMENTKYKGHLYGIPFSRSFPVIFYNREICKRAGIDGEKYPPQTWSDLIEYARQIQRVTQPLHDPTFYPLCLPLEEWFLSNLTRQAGGNLIGDEDFYPHFNQPESAQALAMWINLCKEKLVLAGDNWLDAPIRFNEGQRALLYHTCGSLAYLTKDTDFVGIWPLPYQTTPATEIGGANFVILNNRPEEQQRAAWKFIEWFTQPEQNINWAINTGYLPTLTRCLQLPSYVQYLRSFPGVEVALSQRHQAYPRTSAPYFADLIPLIEETILNTTQGLSQPTISLSHLQDIALDLFHKD